MIDQFECYLRAVRQVETKPTLSVILRVELNRRTDSQQFSDKPGRAVTPVAD